jgi:hypothetical protein
MSRRVCSASRSRRSRIPAYDPSIDCTHHQPLATTRHEPLGRYGGTAFCMQHPVTWCASSTAIDNGRLAVCSTQSPSRAHPPMGLRVVRGVGGLVCHWGEGGLACRCPEA